VFDQAELIVSFALSAVVMKQLGFVRSERLAVIHNASTEPYYIRAAFVLRRMETAAFNLCFFCQILSASVTNGAKIVSLFCKLHLQFVQVLQKFIDFSSS
jgi:hypothetical protein